LGEEKIRLFIWDAFLLGKEGNLFWRINPGNPLRVLVGIFWLDLTRFNLEALSFGGIFRRIFQELGWKLFLNSFKIYQGVSTRGFEGKNWARN